MGNRVHVMHARTVGGKARSALVVLLQLLCRVEVRRASKEVVALSGHPGSLSGGAGDLALALARAYADAPACVRPAQSRTDEPRRFAPIESTA